MSLLFAQSFKFCAKIGHSCDMAKGFTHFSAFCAENDGFGWENGRISLLWGCFSPWRLYWVP